MKTNFTFQHFFTFGVWLLLMYASTVSKVNAQQLNGTYTINASQIASSTNFQSFTSAVDTLKKYGVSGRVIFNIASGTYTGQVIIPYIAGVSVTSTITFQSAQNNADSVKLQYAAASNAPVIRLDSANYINFKYVTVASTTANGRGFELTKAASYDSIISCKTTTGQAGIYASLSVLGRKNVFSKNSVTNGSTGGIYLQGTSASILTDSNVVTGNTINNTTLTLAYTSNTFVANNCVNGGVIGLNISNGRGQRFYYNTFSGSALPVLINYATVADSANEWRNNIIRSSGTSVAMQLVNNGLKNTWNYNLYYTAGKDLLNINGAVMSFANWQSSYSMDINSVTTNPGFLSATDFHMASGCGKFGTPLPSVATDIEGNARSGTQPTIGAFESSYINNIAVDALTQPAFPVAAGTQNLVVRVKNTGTNAVTSFNISYILNGGIPVSLVWSAGSLPSCGTVSYTISGVTLLTANDLIVYTTLPNGVNDTYTKDDTLKTKLNTPLSGTYSIGHSNADYLSFNDAISALSSGGITSPVLFNVKTGTYTEQIVIPVIPGASAAKTVTFQSDANNADSVVVNFAAAANSPIITLDGAGYVNFKYMTVASTTANGRAFQLTTTASYDSIISCKISAGNAGIFANPLAGGYNVFSKNTITGGANGIELRGVNAAISNNNSITGNTINMSTYGLYIEYVTNTFTANNSIISNNIGIRSDYGSNQYFYHNTINAAVNGIYVTYNSNPNNEWRNNIITATGATGNAARIISSTGANNTWDYNLYYSVGPNVFSPNAAAYTGWITSGQDAHSMVANPGFVSATNLHLTSACGPIYGTPLTAVNTDINDSVRNTSMPTKGAYEYSYDNNIAIDSLLQPVYPVTAGAQDLRIRVKNIGRNPVTSFTISYVLNNGSPVSQLWTSTLNSCDTVTIVFTGVNLVNINELVVYSSLPNGDTDTYALNDTLKTGIYTPLNGVYTIGATGSHFQTFSKAVSALKGWGVSGPVIFNVKSGTYTEQIEIPTILGASEAATITFQSLKNNADSVVLNFGPGTNVSTVKLGGSYINFKYLTVAAPNNVNWVFELSGAASYDSIFRCKINGSSTGAIYGSPFSGRKNVLSKNTITAGGIYGIFIEGTSTALSDSNVITANIIQATGGYGLTNNYSSNTFITNNSINASYGIITGHCSGQRLYHNTVIGSLSPSVLTTYDSPLWSNNEWRNNVIVNTSTTGSAMQISNNVGTNNTWDYNLYFSKGPNLFYNSATAFQFWQSIGQDVHSLVYQPVFISATNLQPNPLDSSSWAINGRGIHLDSSIINADINGNPRPVRREQGVPDLGAYEITPTSLPPLATAVGYLAIDSTRTFLFAGDTVAKIKLRPGSTIPGKLDIRQYTGVAPSGTLASNKFMYYYLDIKDNGSGAPSYDLATYYDKAWLGTITSEQDLRLIYKVGANPWLFNSSASHSTVDTAAGILYDEQLAAFGLATGTDLFNPLPVKLLLFKGNTSGKDVLLRWATASEINASSFTVQRSFDGKNFNDITSIGAKGNANATTTYAYKDADPNPKGLTSAVYYRLNMIDNDGGNEFSNIITINWSKDEPEHNLVVFPNPFTNEVNISFFLAAPSIVKVEITDITGRMISSEESNLSEGENTISPKMSDLNKGIYFVSVHINGSQQVYKIMKQ